MKVTATTLPRRSLRASGPPSVLVSVKSGAGPIFDSRPPSLAWCATPMTGHRRSTRAVIVAAALRETAGRCHPPPLQEGGELLISFPPLRSMPSLPLQFVDESPLGPLGLLGRLLDHVIPSAPSSAR